jgi:hypothetical protein
MIDQNLGKAVHSVGLARRMPTIKSEYERLCDELGGPANIGAPIKWPRACGSDALGQDSANERDREALMTLARTWTEAAMHSEGSFGLDSRSAEAKPA